MALGSVKFNGIGLGSSGVLFFGIVAAQFSQHLDRQTLSFVREFGLVLFVFAMGLQLGPGFFASFKAEGWRLNALAAAVVLLAGVLAPLLGWLAGIDPAAIAGLFAGASTNIPALGAAQQSLASLPGMSSERLALPALACAVSYPAAIVGSLGTLVVLKMLFRVDPAREAAEYVAERRKSIEPVMRRTLIVERSELDGLPIDEIYRRFGDDVIVSRVRPANTAEVGPAHRLTPLHVGDSLLAVGTNERLDRFESYVGRRCDEDLLSAAGQLTFSRVAVTSREALGKSLAELGLDSRFGVEVTRITRGDVEMTAPLSLKLQFGDVLQVVGTDEQLRAASEFLGNSLKDLNETHFIPLFLGIALGVVVGYIPIAVPGLANPLRLGLAGGPLLVALLVGRLGHLGRLVWHMPRSANHAFREFGISLFFASLGLAAGDRFFAAVVSPQGVLWLMTGLVISVAPLLAVGILSRAVYRLNFVSLGGLLAGATTNPPALAFMTNLCKSEAPTLAYATVYPLTTLLRIFVAQVLALVLCGGSAAPHQAIASASPVRRVIDPTCSSIPSARSTSRTGP
jgi:putative transport protein